MDAPHVSTRKERSGKKDTLLGDIIQHRSKSDAGKGKRAKEHPTHTSVITSLRVDDFQQVDLRAIT